MRDTFEIIKDLRIRISKKMKLMRERAKGQMENPLVRKIA